MLVNKKYIKKKIIKMFDKKLVRPKNSSRCR